MLFLSLMSACISKVPTTSRNKNEMMRVGLRDQDKMDRDVKFVEHNTGSLWNNTYQARLYDNMYRASKVGDTVTILVDESTTGSNTGSTKSKRKQDQSLSIDGGLGSLLSKFASILNPSNFLKTKTDSKFDADGETERKGSLNATLTAMVTKVYSNGNMEIVGEKHMKINNERQVLIVEGIIRAYDIMPNNTILSSSIADARITYSGFGVVAEKQKPGWLIRALDFIWPF